MTERVARRAFVSGTVQGVFLRDWTVKTAGALGLTGWVRNRADGRVELLAVGPADKVEELLSALHDGGPPRARVTGVQAEDVPVEEHSGFVKVRTA